MKVGLFITNQQTSSLEELHFLGHQQRAEI